LQIKQSAEDKECIIAPSRDRSRCAQQSPTSTVTMTVGTVVAN
jgi:hypothetical protein